MYGDSVKAPNDNFYGNSLSPEESFLKHFSLPFKDTSASWDIQGWRTTLYPLGALYSLSASRRRSDSSTERIEMIEMYPSSHKFPEFLILT